MGYELHQTILTGLMYFIDKLYICVASVECGSSGFTSRKISLKELIYGWAMHHASHVYQYILCAAIE